MKLIISTIFNTKKNNINKIWQDHIKNHNIILICAVAFIFRIAFLLIVFPDYKPVDDAIQYVSLAENIIEGKGPMVSEKRLAYRLPGFGYYIALIWSVFGKSIFLIQFFNIVISVITVLFIYNLSEDLFTKYSNVKYLSSSFVALYPLFPFYACQVLTETLFLFLLALLLKLFWNLKNGNWKNYAFAGLLMGIGIMTKEAFLPIIIVLTIWLFFHLYNQQNRLQFIKNLTLMYIFTLLIILPWIIRNYNITGNISLLSSEGGTRLWYANSPKADGSGVGSRSLLLPEIENLPENERSSAYKDKALKFIINNPGKFIILVLKRQIWLWHLGYHNGGMKEIVFLVIYIPIFIFSILGFILMLRNNLIKSFFLFSVPFSVIGISVFFQSVGRYRLPAELIMCIFSAYFINYLLIKYFQNHEILNK